TMTASVAAAADRKPLPAFTVSGTDGTRIDSAALFATGRRLVIYVTPACVACDRLLRSLDGWGGSQLAEHAALIVGAAPESVETIRPLLGPTAASIAVYVDADGGAARALGLAQRPALLGVELGQIDWMVQGVLNDPQSVKSLVESWLDR